MPLKGGEVDPNGTLYLGEGQWGVPYRKSVFSNETGYFSTYGYANNLWKMSVDKGSNVVSYVPYALDGGVMNGSTMQYFNFGE